jgi:hypothetical protein
MPFIPKLSKSLSLFLFLFLLSLFTTLYMTQTLLYFPFLCDLLKGPLPIPLCTLNTSSNFYRDG